MSESYVKCTTYQFTVDNEIWEVTDTDNYCGRRVHFSETRCNGQEDSHISAVAFKTDDGGKWDIEEGRSMILQYRCRRTLDALEAFFTEHGQPPDDITG